MNDVARSLRSGDLVLLERGDGQRQVALACAVDGLRVEVALVHTEAECATDADLLVPGALPYPAWIASDTLGTVPARRCRRRLGRLPGVLRRVVLAAVLATEPWRLPQLERGLPLQGGADWRVAERRRLCAWLEPLQIEVIAELEP